MTVVHTSTRFAACLFTASTLLALHGTAHADDEHKPHVMHQASDISANAGKRLSMGEVITKLERAGYSQITEVELDDGHYEVEARDKQGQRIDLDVHAQTGKVLRTQLED